MREEDKSTHKKTKKYSQIKFSTKNLDIGNTIRVSGNKRFLEKHNLQRHAKQPKIHCSQLAQFTSKNNWEVKMLQPAKKNINEH